MYANPVCKSSFVVAVGFDILSEVNNLSNVCKIRIE